jgi:hypothetical protein
MILGTTLGPALRSATDIGYGRQAWAIARGPTNITVDGAYHEGLLAQ